MGHPRVCEEPLFLELHSRTVSPSIHDLGIMDSPTENENS